MLVYSIYIVYVVFSLQVMCFAYGCVTVQAYNHIWLYTDLKLVSIVQVIQNFI